MYLPLLKFVLRSSKLTKLLQKHIKSLLSFDFSRSLLSHSYNSLSPKEKKRFHQKFAKIYRQDTSSAFNGKWTMNFMNTKIIAPIIKEDMWLTWDAALSILGHDLEIKTFYEQLLKSKDKPNVFFDVGANYGTHSFLFQSQGIETHSFEPNPRCYPYFEQLFKVNALMPNIIKKAVGAAPGVAVLTFPKKETWLGSLSQNVKDTILEREDLINIDVEITTLDTYTQNSGINPDLIKIDTEGFEIDVLSGASNVLKNTKPIIVFECNSKDEKFSIFEKLVAFDYSIYDFKNLAKPLTIEMFKTSRKRNFVAFHKNSLLLTSH
jgi:FkbM family methyltransferase